MGWAIPKLGYRKGDDMHRFLLRIKDVLFQRVKVEAESRGISINDMFTEIIEVGLLKIYEKEEKYGKVKH